jgi:glycine hydroxymethyltransferase
MDITMDKFMSRSRALEETDPEIAKLIRDEQQRQSDHLELIASENIASLAVRQAMMSVLTDKYAEGYPGRRYYGGCEVVDQVENLAIERLRALYKTDKHVNVQPHSGAQANMAAYFALIKPGDTILAMSLAHGGHLTHGSPVNFSGELYNVVSYGVTPDTERIDYDELRRLAFKHQPKMIVSGASAYSRAFDFARIREIADEVGALHMCDMAHYSGLIAAEQYPSPMPYAHVVTSTTHKSLRGPRGGIIFCDEQYAAAIDKSVFPGVQGGPLMHVIAAKAVCFLEALQPAFREYQKQVKTNAQTLALALEKLGLRIVSGGTDSHLMLVDLRSTEITGKLAQSVLDSVHITTNKNAIPYDPEKPFVTSGIRLGTPALTSRNMCEEQMQEVAGLIYKALKNYSDDAVLSDVKSKVLNLCQRFPIC